MTRVNDEPREAGRGKKASEVQPVKGVFVCVCVIVWVRERESSQSAESAVKRDGHLLCLCTSLSLFSNCSLLLENNQCTVIFWLFCLSESLFVKRVHVNIKTTAVSSSAQCRQEVWSHWLSVTDNYRGFELPRSLVVVFFRSAHIFRWHATITSLCFSQKGLTSSLGTCFLTEGADPFSWCSA